NSLGRRPLLSFFVRPPAERYVNHSVVFSWRQMSTSSQTQRLSPRQRWIVAGVGTVATAMPLLVCGLYLYLFVTLDTPEANFRAYVQLLVDALSQGETKKALTIVSLPFLIVLLAGWIGTSTVLGVFGRRTILSRAILAANEKIGLLELFFVCLAAVGIVSGVVLAFVGPPFVSIPFLLSGLGIIVVAQLVKRWFARVPPAGDDVSEATRLKAARPAEQSAPPDVRPPGVG